MRYLQSLLLASIFSFGTLFDVVDAKPSKAKGDKPKGDKAKGDKAKGDKSEGGLIPELPELPPVLPKLPPVLPKLPPELPELPPELPESPDQDGQLNEDGEVITGLDDLVKILARAMFSEVKPFRCGDKQPKIDCDDVVSSIFRLVEFETCQFGERKSLSTLASPILDVIDTCSAGNRSRDRRQAQRNLQSKEAVSQCVTRFEDATFEGKVGIPKDRGGDVGTVNKYGWATDFSDKCGCGVVIHSAGGLSVIDGEFSNPTITLRNRLGTIIYRAAVTNSDVNFAGLRSVSIVDCDFEANTVKIVAASVGEINGAFVEFDLDLNRYSGKPIFGLNPIQSQVLPCPSVRTQMMLSEDIILYAPLYDNGLQFNKVTALRLYNWRTATELGVQITFRPNTFPIAPFNTVWDFECKDELCWITTTGVSDNNVDILQLTESTSARLFSFPSALLDPIPLWDVDIPVRESFLNYQIPFSALSLQPLAEYESLACTLSGFLFVLAVATLGGVDATALIIDQERRASGILNVFELGFRQQCNICGAGGGCRRPKFNGLKNTNVYIWDIQECGGKIFVGTNDQSVFFGNALVEAFIISLAEVSCLSRVVNLVGCINNPGCAGDFMNRYDGCENAVENFLERAINGPPSRQSDRRERLAALLLSRLFLEDIEPDDFGFDLYAIDKNELLFWDNPVFQPVTLNGFRQLAPEDNIDEGVRNLECHIPDPNVGGDPKLIISTAVFRDDKQTSSTFVLNVNDNCDNILF